MSDSHGKTISHDDYLRMVGLLTLARDCNRRLAEIEESLRGITGEHKAPGEVLFDDWTGEAVYNGEQTGLATLLDRLGLAVAPPDTE